MLSTILSRKCLQWSPESCLGAHSRFFVVGDQVSQLPGWQEGAMMSAQHLVEQISTVKAKKLKCSPM